MQKSAQFTKSKVPCLIKHRAGTYYASAKVSGKVIRRSLETSDYNEATNRLPAALAEIRGAKNASQAGTLAVAIHDEAHREDPTIKVTTRKYYRETSAALARVSKSMPTDPLQKSIAKVTLADLRSLMDKYAATYTETRYNGALALLRRAYERAIEAGHVGTNVPSALKRIQPKQTKHDMPTAATFNAILEDILGQRKAHSKACAASVEILAYTGLRSAEAQDLTWRDIKEDHLVVRTAKSKDDAVRQVPLIPAAVDLFERLRASGLPTGPDDPVMPLKRPREALTNSCRRLGIRHLRVHDLRHLFATRCIEAGVDLPTIADWLGHKDGGVLVAQVYGHLCRKHSATQAQKVVM